MNKDRSTESLLQDHLEIVTAALTRCVREAEPDPGDEYGTRRNTELCNAAALLKASARLGFALAKLKGEFRHNISVSRSVRVSGSDQENDVRVSGSDQENDVRVSGSDQENDVRVSGSDQENDVRVSGSDGAGAHGEEIGRGTPSQN